MSNRINKKNRIIGFEVLNEESLSDLAPEVVRFAFDSPNKFLRLAR